MRLRPVFVPRHGDDALWRYLLAIRNACSDGVTRRTALITWEEQWRYRLTYSEHVRHYLYYAEDRDGPVAFSRLEWREDGFVYPTVGVHPVNRGNGYAWEVVQHAMLAAGGPVKGEWLVANKAIVRVDGTLGWVPTGEPVDGVQPIEAPWPPKHVQLYDAGANRQQEAYDEIVRYHANPGDGVA